MTKVNKLYWWTHPRAIVRSILMLDDTPHSIALGTAVGVFIAMTPTVGIQMILVMLFALVTGPFFRFNRVAPLIAVYLSNPVTIVPIYWFNYEVGTLFFPGDLTQEKIDAVVAYRTWSEWTAAWKVLIVDVGAPLIAGSLIVATVCGVITYPFMRWLLDATVAPGPPA